MDRSPGKAKTPAASDQETTSNRSWLSSVTWSATVMAVLLFVAVAANVLVGRVIHWEIVTVLGVLGFVFLSIGRRHRTI